MNEKRPVSDAVVWVPSVDKVNDNQSSLVCISAEWPSGPGSRLTEMPLELVSISNVVLHGDQVLASNVDVILAMVVELAGDHMWTKLCQDDDCTLEDTRKYTCVSFGRGAAAW